LTTLSLSVQCQCGGGGGGYIFQGSKALLNALEPRLLGSPGWGWPSKSFGLSPSLCKDMDMYLSRRSRHLWRPWRMFSYSKSETGGTEQRSYIDITLP